MENKNKWIHITVDDDGARIDMEGLESGDYFGSIAAMIKWMTDDLNVAPREIIEELVKAVEGIE